MAGDSVSGVLGQVTPPAGADVAYLVTFANPIAADGNLTVDVDLTAEVEPPLVPSTTTPSEQRCPGPDGILFTSDDIFAPQTGEMGKSQILMDNQFVVVFIEEAVQEELSVTPSTATLEVGQSQTFDAFTYSDRTVSRGVRSLDRRWSAD